MIKETNSHVNLIQTLDDFFKNFPEQYKQEEQEKIKLAWDFMTENSKTATRPCGKPYMEHPLRVAVILAELKMDAETIIAGILHNSLSFSTITPEILEQKFGKTISSIVKGTSKITELKVKNKTLQQADSIRKMLFAMIDDIRIIIIKLADRLDRIRNMQGLPLEKQKSIAQEIIDIWAPLANRLGMSSIKTELEDLSLKYLNPEAFAHIKRIVAQKKEERSHILQKAQEKIYSEAVKADITEIKITSRAKHFWSIYQKMKRRNKASEGLYDLLAMRILCKTEADCYTILGLVHRVFKPLDGRFKDYIAMPKANGYQSLHTTVMCFEGKPLEIQIRTFEMHYVAEHGIASHWLYKKGTNHDSVKLEDLSIMNQLRELTKQRFNDEEFLRQIKEELLKDSIFVFTPKGDVVELPMGSTAIDFAYHIHSAIGEKITGAKANGQIIPLSEPLRSTQVIDILTSPNAHPTINQLRIVHTSKARSKIKAYLMANEEGLIFDKNIVARNKLLEHDKTLNQPNSTDKNSQEKLSQEKNTEQHKEAKPEKIRVDDTSNFVITIAKCCKPTQSDSIVGYVSRGRGIVVHKSTCKNLLKIPEIENRLVDVIWEQTLPPDENRLYLKGIQEETLFNRICEVVKDTQGFVVSGKLSEAGNGFTEGTFTIRSKKKDHIKKIAKALRKISELKSIKILK